MRQDTGGDATIIHSPSSTKIKDGKRDPEIHHAKKGDMYYYGVCAHIGVGSEPVLAHIPPGTAATIADWAQFDQLLHRDANHVCGVAGHTGLEKRPEYQAGQKS